MPNIETTGKKFHSETKHSYLSVMLDPNYVDASTQPSSFKSYPKFYRRLQLDVNNPLHDFIWLTSAITSGKNYQWCVAHRRVNPSAGGLYPTEVYVQIRGIEGIVDGIYHLEVANNSLTLIYELIDDGLESYIFSETISEKSIKGFIFLVSCVYYRSDWKYKNRGVRYCFLDSGHHLGAIEASAYVHDRSIRFLFDFDKLALNADLGFENKEFVTACAVSGEFENKKVRRLRLPVPFVCGTDYFEQNKFIEQAYNETAILSSSQQKLQYPQIKFDREKFRQTINNRRSVRRFRRASISFQDYSEILDISQQPISCEDFEEIEIYSVVNRVEGLSPGLYKGISLVKEGYFHEKVGYLCINQLIVRDSAVTLFFISDYRNYQTAMLIAGLLGHKLYLASNYLGINCSGIGAFYDDEVQELLGTSKDVLYAIVIGN
ncbi:MAG: nitroreductase family protein [Cyanobacteria bacterium P01_A01_bin.84]